VGGLLIIEDDPDSRAILGRELEEAGFEVRSAAEAATGLEMARADPPDLILLDISMPGMDGLEAARQIRADERLGRVPILVVTAHAMVGEWQRVLDAGGNDCVTKPYDLDTLLEKIRQLLQEGSGRH